MAIVYPKARLTPSKLELITGWLDAQSWGGTGEVTVLGAYRFDDPDGEVGFEGHLVSRDDVALHVPLTYRGAPLDELNAVLVGQLQHSVLGERFVYDAGTDPVGIGCLVRALRGEQEQARYELRVGDEIVGEREPNLTIQLAEGRAAESPIGCVVIPLVDGTQLRIAQVLDADEPAGRARLIANWAGGSGVIAGLS
ncbi:hypothetical protein MLP_26750 [Microlunatus phosphovorus NM-1]|uniref:Maltokinase N-terminal cap domain-containing protein n=1 Tax=Microlunatus phosphovorus (strain ATCC 700054 / DSM 10555 / JCM 9379 / NBRC 101784 / NCIMB 13414 / VKM Ac-1990 / NM-1) TaxID=1032480 RepID=F5XI20_MICPN|nr:hypothetical protein [Microlunatus phosphovorus]BAK35689.1 hypothetical protein MLP_26750 [Microlunatus phosphovorus NM-1]